MNRNFEIAEGIKTTLTTLGINDPENIAVGIADAIVRKNKLTVSKVKEVPVTSILEIVGAVAEGSRAFVVDGSLILVNHHEEQVNPYEDLIEIWENLLEEDGLSSYNLPFQNFYYYYKRYLDWIEQEEDITTDDTVFVDYMSEIEQIEDLTTLSIPENEAISVADVQIVTVYTGRVMADIQDLMTKVQDEADAFELLLQTAEAKRAAFATQLATYNALLAD